MGRVDRIKRANEGLFRLYMAEISHDFYRPFKHLTIHLFSAILLLYNRLDTESVKFVPNTNVFFFIFMISWLTFRYIVSSRKKNQAP